MLSVWTLSAVYAIMLFRSTFLNSLSFFRYKIVLTVVFLESLHGKHTNTIQKTA